MVFIAICGTRSSGKQTIRDYLVNTKGFANVQLKDDGSSPSTVRFDDEEDSLNSTSLSSESAEMFIMHRSKYRVEDDTSGKTSKHLSFLSLEGDATPLHSPAPIRAAFDKENGGFNFSSSQSLLDFVTRSWRTNFVTLDLRTREQVELFVRRPFFMLLSIDAPLYERYKRQNSGSLGQFPFRQTPASLEDFVRADDALVFGTEATQSSSLEVMHDLVDIRIKNDFSDTSELFAHLDELDLLEPSHLRPNWDSYFMTLASLASRRSNCMKRRVGAVLVRDRRIVSTGYNGTPRSVKNCNEGGCGPCNGIRTSSGDLEECVCLHAEENALLEAGRDRVGEGATMYCNTCPCLKCTVKIIQTGVKEVVYNLGYKVDSSSAKLFHEAGVQLRKFDPRGRRNISASPA